MTDFISNKLGSSSGFYHTEERLVERPDLRKSLVYSRFISSYEFPDMAFRKFIPDIPVLQLKQ